MTKGNTYSVTLITENQWKDTYRPLAVGVDKAVAKSIRRYYNKSITSHQTIMVINRIYCTNHADFER